MVWTRERMAAEAARELRDGYYVNLSFAMTRGGHIDVAILGAMDAARDWTGISVISS